MKQGVWIRLCTVLTILWPFLSEAHAADRIFYLQARRLDRPNHQTILRSPYRDSLSVGQLMPIEVFLVFENKDNEYYEYSLLVDTTGVPLFFYREEEQLRGLISNQKSPTDTVRQILYIRPRKQKRIEFTVSALLTEKFGKTRADQKFLFNVRAVDSTLIPVIVPDSAEAAIGFAQGSNKTILWQPATAVRNAQSQEAYAFAMDDPTNLLHSAQRLFKDSNDALKRSVFENLQDGRLYGYFARMDFLNKKGNPVMIYSDLYRCTQDKSPPQKVERPIIVPEPTGYRVSWDAATDAISGVDKYLIYRASDTGSEEIVHTLTASSQPFYVWLDTDFNPAIKYYYRVRAVDRVGNIGDGERSLVVDASTEFPSTQEIVFPEAEEVPSDSVIFVSGTRDTIDLINAVNLDSIRVRVVRDDKQFFNSPPDLPMRVFDSGIITAEENPFPANWIFDYGLAGNTRIDSNFVNGHTYYPVVTYYYRHGKTVIDSLIPRLMDCFNPADIRNVKVQSMVIGDGNHTDWKMQLTWDKPVEVQASPLKAFHIFRHLEGEAGFTLHATIQPPDHYHYIDESLLYLDGIQNPLVTYRVIAEDRTGHKQTVESCEWEARDRVLNSPKMRWTVRSATETVIRDTLYTHADDVELIFENFNLDAVAQFYALVNQEQQLLLNPQTGQLTVQLDSNLTSIIQVRAVYRGGRTSVWSEPMIAVKDSVPVSLLTVRNNPDSSGGYLYLTWDRTSLAAKHYTVYRSTDDVTYTPVDTVSASRDTLRWADQSVLIAYNYYFYKVRPFTKTNRLGQFSNSDSDYCNRPPSVAEHSVYYRGSGEIVITIDWNRALPIETELGFTTYVDVYEDYLDEAYCVTRDTVSNPYTIYNFERGSVAHNYVFQLREVLNDDTLHRESGISYPYTVSLKQLDMEALTQPRKKIYLNWDHQIVDTLDVKTFHLLRSNPTAIELDTMIATDQYEYMDTAAMLKHGESYHYQIIAVNEYDQVLAANDTTVLCDSGRVYIPYLDADSLHTYFNTDSLQVCWYWTSVEGKRDPTTSRGADSLFLQISTRYDFPGYPLGQTVEYRMRANASVLCGKFKIPRNAGEANHEMYVRMWTIDKWGHPVPRIITDTLITIYDIRPPEPVSSFHVTRTRAVDTTSDSVTVQFSWSDNSLADPNARVANVAYYKIIRKWEDQQETVGRIPVGDPLNFEKSYTYIEQNRPHEWQLVSVDSAKNQTVHRPVDNPETVWINQPFFMETPDENQLKPIDFRQCRIESLQEGVTDYAIEIAMFESHFALAYNLDVPDELDHLLCRSDWLPADQTGYSCATGWGNHFQMDTVFFRIKTRHQDTFESGWSSIIAYSSQIDKGTGSGLDLESAIPMVFEVSQNYPNPFNGATTIRYGLPEPGQVTIRIFNCTGALVRVLEADHINAGYHTTRWMGDNQAGNPVSSGLYFCELSVKTETEINQHRMKMMMLK
jgi:hypothetical protein